MRKISGHSVRSRRAAWILIMIAALFMLSACSEQAAAESPTPEATATATPTAVLTPEPTQAPTATPTAAPTPSPTPEVSFPPLATSTAGAYVFPQVVADKTSANTGEDVNFKIITSENVKSVQTVIDGDPGKVYTEYTASGGVRIWRTTISFTKGGKRKVQYKCAMLSGGSALIPEDPLRIDVTFDYTAESTSKEISTGKTVTFTLKTPDSIKSVDAVVDGVNQNIKYTKPASDKDGVKVWKIPITFFKLGTRSVQFNAYVGKNIEKTFPDTGITIIVQASVG